MQHTQNKWLMQIYTDMIGLHNKPHSGAETTNVNKCLKMMTMMMMLLSDFVWQFYFPEWTHGDCPNSTPENHSFYSY